MNLGGAELLIIAAIVGIPIILIVVILRIVLANAPNKQTQPYPPDWSPPPEQPPPPPAP
jgi:hypothetical protein